MTNDNTEKPVDADGDRTLSAYDAKRLAMCEQTIGRGMLNFLEVISALIEIREHELYPPEHASFERYLSSRWGMNLNREGLFLTKRILYRLCHATLVESGLPRSDANKQRAVRLTLSVQPNWSDKDIAAHVGVNPQLVRRLRAEGGNAEPRASNPVVALGDAQGGLP